MSTVTAATANSQLNSGTILLAFVAMMAGLGGTYAIRTYTRQPQPTAEAPKAPPAEKPVKITVPLASRDIPAGTEISLDDVALYRMTREEINQQIPAKTFMTNPEQIIGKILMVDLPRGKTFATKDFFPSGQSPGVSKRLQPGLRAMTVVLNSTNALLGFAGPGQRVDVLFHFSDESGGASGGRGKGKGNGPLFGHHDFNAPHRRDYWGNSLEGDATEWSEMGFSGATSTLAQNVEILALGRRAIPTDAASGLPDDQVAVTLAVNPRQAELLRVADGHGELSLTLRSPDDEQQVELMNPVTLDQIIDVDKTVHQMEIYRGKSVSRLNFRSGLIVKRRTFNDDPPQVASSSAGGDSRQATPAPPPTFVPVWSPYMLGPNNAATTPSISADAYGTSGPPAASPQEAGR
ncbi:MAG: Flp pilus assembly protein CpaB [Planctomycetales bacterium]|nr:Flp pilus assembly protein CpaB [Planctomycetales bacterium]